MPILSGADEARVREMLAGLSDPVTLVFFTQALNCETCEPTRQILTELAALSDRLSVEEHSFPLEPDAAAALGIDRVPAIVPMAGGRDSRIRFLGIPSGYEFMSLIDAIQAVSSGEPGLSADSLAALAEASDPIALQVFVTPTWPHCPRAVSLANRMAVASPRVTSTIVEASEYPDLVRRYRVSGVPKTVVNGTVEILGARDEQTFVRTAVGAAGGPQTPNQ